MSNPAKGGTRLDDFDFKHTFKGKNDLLNELKMKERDARKELIEETINGEKLVDYESSTEESNNTASEDTDSSDNLEDLLTELEHKEPVNIESQFKLKRKWDEDVVFSNTPSAPKKAKHINDKLNSAEHIKFMSKLFK
eukprot:NODE_150_length_17275_cov_0.559618.p12 type:complete len:138 gc:universal NODE_150_length_17275_cov_0.559618:2164-2577(+)